MKVRAAILLTVMVSNNSSADSISYDPATGDYHVSYTCDGAPFQTTLEPTNKVAPAIASHFADTGESISFSFDVEMGAASRQPLRLVALDPILPVFDTVSPPNQALPEGATRSDFDGYRQAAQANAPPGWMTFHLERTDGRERIAWGRAEVPRSTFVAGARQTGFRFSSVHLPAIVIAKFVGDGAIWNLSCEGPDDPEIAEQLAAVELNNYVPRFAAAPGIQMATPANWSNVLLALSGHTIELEQWQLLGSPLAAEIREYFAEAVTELKSTNNPGAVTSLAKARAALRKTYPAMDSEEAAHATPPAIVPPQPVRELRSMISPYDILLTARVIDFDVAFVISRLGGTPTPPDVPPGPQVPWVPCLPGYVCAPPLDSDGSLEVSWSTPTNGYCAQASLLIGWCEEEFTGFVLQIATNSTFSDAKTTYDGPNKFAEVSRLAPGNYYFRVKAHSRHCQRTNWFSGEDGGSCMLWGDVTTSDTPYYSQGLNRTLVTPY